LEEVAERPPDRARGAAAALPAVALIERLDAPPDDQAEAVWRLFDGRDNGEPVASDEWHPCPSFAELDSGDMLGQRREWYRRLAAERAGEKG
jgi:hypothetical protein